MQVGEDAVQTITVAAKWFRDWGGKGPAMQFILIHALKKIHVICVERRMYGRTNPIV